MNDCLQFFVKGGRAKGDVARLPNLALHPVGFVVRDLRVQSVTP